MYFAFFFDLFLLMKHFTLFSLLIICSFSLRAQVLKTNQPLLDSAFQLAVWTIDHNTHNGLIEAGGGYGGEWTRDCAINCWNAVSFLRPEIAANSLWSVTEDSLTIGHQYWDKIIWTIAAWTHYWCTRDTDFLSKAYVCAANTMHALEDTCFDQKYGLFMGPAVFQDGIAGYDEPVYDPAIWDDSFVLHHPNSRTIKCLSTNAVYYQSYRILSSMGRLLGDSENAFAYMEKADRLEENIRHHFYRKDENKFYYLIDHTGKKHDYQEGLGLAFVLLFGVLSPEESEHLIKTTFVTDNGIPCVYPSFPRNTADKPGRHNMMIWPHVNMLYASGCARQQQYDPFYKEMEILARLAMQNGKGDFYEIYTIDGIPSGGYQCGALWDEKEHQTWCATGYLRLFLHHVFGINPIAKEGFYLHPIGMKDGSQCQIKDLRYKDMNLTITVKGHTDNPLHSKIRCKINGKRSTPHISNKLKGDVDVKIWVK